MRTFQAEDEIAAITAAIGAAVGGDLAVTTTSGPGLSLKAEALGLAVSHDDDGKASSQKPQAAPLPTELTAVQAKRLRDLIKERN